MKKIKGNFQYYIGLGLIVNALAYLLYENGMIIHSIKSCLYIVGISLEIIGLMKYRRSCTREG